MFDHLYRNDQRDSTIFEPVKEWFRPPATFEYGEWHLVAEIPKRDGSDGNPSRIYESRMPARFFKIEVLDSTNSIGEPKKGFCLSTGSGDEMGALCVRLALAARDGMLGCEEGKAPPLYVHAGVPARRQKIETFRSLRANWDSYGCQGMSQKSVDAALAMEPLLPAGFVSVVPISGGGVMFGTKGEAVTVEIYADDDADIAGLISLGD